MSELTRKEMSKTICNHLRKDSLVDGVNETYLIASVMDALKEIKECQTPTDETEIRSMAYDRFCTEAIEHLSTLNNLHGYVAVADCEDILKGLTDKLKERETHGLVR